MKLMGETIFVDMMTRPQHCLETMHWIAEAYVVLCRHFSQMARLPILIIWRHFPKSQISVVLTSAARHLSAEHGKYSEKRC